MPFTIVWESAEMVVILDCFVTVLFVRGRCTLFYLDSIFCLPDEQVLILTCMKIMLLFILLIFAVVELCTDSAASV